MIELLICTVLWGTSFVAQKLGAAHLGPFAINCTRSLIAAGFLQGLVVLRDRRMARRGETPGRWSRADWFGGLLSGLCLAVALMAQQRGIELTTPGVSGFLTSNYMLLVPVFGIFVGSRTSLRVWLGVAMALVGSYFICFATADSGGLANLAAIGGGEAWTLLCAAVFALQIRVVDRFAGRVDMLHFSMVQMLVAGGASFPFVFLPGELARTNLSSLAGGLPAILYLGLVSSGLGYTLQNLGQAKVSASRASVVMGLESVFAALSGWLLLGDVMTLRQIGGCLLVFLATFVARR